MTAPRAMNAAVIGLPTRSQGEAAFLRRQRAQVRSGKPAGIWRRARVIPVRVRRRSKDALVFSLGDGRG